MEVEMHFCSWLARRLDFKFFAVDSHRYAKHCILQSIFPHHSSFGKCIQCRQKLLESLWRKYCYIVPSSAWNLRLWLKFNLLFKVLLSWKITFPISFELLLQTFFFVKTVAKFFACSLKSVVTLDRCLQICKTLWQFLIVYDSIFQSVFFKMFRKLG